MKIKLNPNENIRACCLSITFLRILNPILMKAFSIYIFFTLYQLQARKKLKWKFYLHKNEANRMKDTLKMLHIIIGHHYIFKRWSLRRVKIAGMKNWQRDSNFYQWILSIVKIALMEFMNHLVSQKSHWG